ncbi:MAG TPA: lamin tail domain-containing protein, partial [Phycisphaerales bacterium]|nr:lamin tail domain-containing protein [Phycisphaerales bacterium]
MTARAEAIQEPYQALRQNAEFRMSFADHAHRHLFNDGAAMPPASYARYKELADEVELAIIAESARWGDQARSTPYTLADWQAKRDYILNTYMPQRPAIVLNQLRTAALYPAISAPVFKVNGVQRHGGHVLPTDDLSMTLPEDTSYRDVELVGERVAVRVHVPMDNSLGLSWTARTFVPGASWSDGSTTTGVGYERDSGYETLIGTDVGDAMYNRSTSVFLRMGFGLDGGEDFDRLVLQMKYDDGFIAYLNGVRVCTSGNVTNETPGTATAGNHEAGAAFEEFDITAFKGALAAGTNILAIHGINITTTSSDMLILPKLVGKVVDAGGNSQPIWYTLDGSDPRLLGGARNPMALEYPGASIRLAGSSRVRARTLYNGNWSALNDAVFAVGPVAESLRISEIMYHPRSTGSPIDADKEYIELVNIGAAAINLNLVRFTNGVQFTFADRLLNPGEHVLVVRDMAAFEAEYGPGLNVAGQYIGALDNSGERITLEDAAGTIIHSFRYRDDWYGITDGGGFSLTVRDLFATDPNVLNEKSGWRPSAEAGGSPGWDDTGVVPDPGAVVINEVLAHSHAGAAD